jgi:hypothetical protein
MENLKKINGLKTPLHKILSNDEMRQSLNYAYFINGFVYATDSKILIKQSLEKVHQIDPNQIMNLEGKALSKDALKQMWAFDVFDWKEDKVICNKGRATAEFYYQNGLTPPNFELILTQESKYNFDGVIGINANLLNTLSLVMAFDASIQNHNLTLEISTQNSRIVVTSVHVNKDIQVGIIMPFNTSHEQ